MEASSELEPIKASLTRSRSALSTGKVIVLPENFVDKLDSVTSRYSLVSTCKNEEEHIVPWLNAIRSQSCFPSEVIVCDGGSSDQTVMRIRDWQKYNSEFPLQLISAPGATIASGRNLAVQNANEKIVLFSDVGSIPQPDWAGKLLHGFLLHEDVILSMGQTKVDPQSSLQYALLRLLKEDLVNPESYIPSARSLAVKKNAIDAIGGFPVELTRAGEDTLFHFRIRERTSGKFAYVPTALVSWSMPQGFISLWKMVACYAKGDREAGLFYKDYIVRLNECLALILGGVFSAAFFYLVMTRGSLGYLFALYVALYLMLSPLLGYAHRLDTVSLANRLIAPFLLITAQSFGFLSGCRRVRS